MEGFGASDAWLCDAIGKYWPEAEKKRLTELLFSRDFDDGGKPKGIGLSIWRFNIGAGSAEQGASSGIRNSYRRVEGFLNDDGSYDWSKQLGQQWFLQEAKTFGVETTIAFINSPPVQLTRNGIAHGSGGFHTNLKQDSYDDFARFIVKVLANFQKEGLAFDYISPVNEPQYQWSSSKQEGSPYTNQEIYRLVGHLDAELTRAGLAARIYLPECADYRNAVDYKGRVEHSYQIREFFDSESALYLGDFSTVAPVFAAHSYWTTYTNEMIYDLRSRIQNLTTHYGIRFHQSEYSLIGLNQVEDDKPGSELEIGLFIGKIIHADLTVANAASWSFWTAVSANDRHLNRYLLVSPNFRDTTKIHLGGDPQWSKSLAALGHYSLFVRPGFKRMDLQGADLVSGLLASAYASPRGEKAVIVLTNLKDHSVSTALSLNGAQVSGDVRAYLTDEEHNLKPLTEIELPTIELPPQSMLTIIFGLG